MSRALLLRATAPWALAAGAALVGLLWTAPVAGGHPVAGAQPGPALPALATGPSPVERAAEGIASLPPSRTSPRRSKRAAETRPPPDATDRGSADDPTVLARVTEVLMMTVIILLFIAVVFGLVTVVFFGVASTAVELFPFWGVVAPFALVLGYGLWRGLCSAVSSLQGDRYRSEAAARPRAEGPLSSSHDSWADRR